MSVLSDSDVTVPAIARRLGVTRQAVQRVADQLVGSGHLEPQENPRHRSSPVMHLTDLGHRTLQSLWDASDEPRAQISRGLSAEELRTASATLQELLDGFKIAGG
jgi:DNA-binding MarR family transcriptional regulator